MNNQQAFNQMVEHLRKQKKRSYEESISTCLYRGPNGLKCAIGALIPDELYREEMEGMAVTRLLINEQNKYPKLYELFEQVDSQFLSEMQDIHDFNPIEQWERRFELCAGDYNLDYTAPEAAL